VIAVGWYRQGGKRAFDLVLAAPLLVGTLPLILLASAGVVLSSRGPAFFTQERIGLHGRPFKLFKLRTMVDEERDPTLQVHSRHASVTPLGAWLRRFKIDELPQLWNVVRGQMSVVGPRPDLAENVRGYPASAVPRLTVRPGLTGLAQVSGNALLSWEARWAIDVDYVNSVSLVGDIRILFHTIGVVLLGERLATPPSVVED